MTDFNLLISGYAFVTAQVKVTANSREEAKTELRNNLEDYLDSILWHYDLIEKEDMELN